MSTLSTKLVSVFPAFSTLQAAQIDYWITRALLTTSPWVDDHATMLLACHFMVLNGLGNDAAAQIVAGGMSGMTKVSIGPLSAEFSADAAAKLNQADYDATTYGRQFKLILLAHNAGGLVSDAGAYVPYNLDTADYVYIR